MLVYCIDRPLYLIEDLLLSQKHWVEIHTRLTILCQVPKSISRCDYAALAHSSASLPAFTATGGLYGSTYLQDALDSRALLA